MAKFPKISLTFLTYTELSRTMAQQFKCILSQNEEPFPIENVYIISFQLL